MKTVKALPFLLILALCPTVKAGSLTGLGHIDLKGTDTWVPANGYDEKQFLAWSPNAGYFRGGFNWTSTLPSTGFCSLVFGDSMYEIGAQSAAFGYSNRAGVGALVSGSNNEATGSYSAAFGNQTDALGYASLAANYQTVAQENYSTAFGYRTRTFAPYQTVVGKNNDTSWYWLHWDFDGDGVIDTIPAQAMFIVGDGGMDVGDCMLTPANPGHNAFVVYAGGTTRVGHDLLVARDLQAQRNILVLGDARIHRLILPAGASAGKVLTSDASGIATWEASQWTTSSSNISLNTTGNVGIGQSSPTYKLDVRSASPNVFRVSNGTLSLGISQITSGGTGARTTLQVSNGAFEVFDQSAGASRLWIAAGTGNLGIGTTSPVSKLTINTPGGTNSAGSEWDTHALSITTGTAGRTLWFGYDDTANAGYINAAGNSQVRPVLIQSRGGTVAINTATPDTSKSLHVNGSVKIEGTVTIATASGDISMGAFQ